MNEPRLFEDFGPVVVVTTSMYRTADGAWDVLVNYRREGTDTFASARYEALSLGEAIDVIAASALS